MTGEELKSILAQTEAADRAWVNGVWDDGYGALLSGAEDVTIFGPFGGPAAQGAMWTARAAKAVQQFSNGASSLKLVSHHHSGDLLVLIMISEQTADIGGHAAHPWCLRVTQIYRREGDAWKVVHRHADPLVQPRSPAQTLKLALGTE